MGRLSALAWAQLLLVVLGAEEEECLANGEGCATLPTFPDCEYSCQETECIGPNTGNKKQIWATCPHGPDGCKNCQDRHEQCPAFASAYGGFGCEDNPSFMIDVCANSCNTCHLRSVTERCGHLANMPESLQPGTINATFQRILSIRSLAAEVLSQDPWIVKFPKFLSEEEIEWLMSDRPWKEASDIGEVDAYGRHTQKFSSNRRTDVAWCQCECTNHPIGKQIRARISELARVHPDYFESLQFLRYSPGQYYRPHHDAPRALMNDPNNVVKHRVYTFFMYLNDVESGGATYFPRLGLTVRPERGSAILWPSVFNHNPRAIDMRTEHEAKVVEKGVKFSVNAWMFLGPHRPAHNVGCSGSPIDS